MARRMDRAMVKRVADKSTGNKSRVTGKTTFWSKHTEVSRPSRAKLMIFRNGIFFITNDFL